MELNGTKRKSHQAARFREVSLGIVQMEVAVEQVIQLSRTEVLGIDVSECLVGAQGCYQFSRRSGGGAAQFFFHGVCRTFVVGFLRYAAEEMRYAALQFSHFVLQEEDGAVFVGAFLPGCVQLVDSGTQVVLQLLYCFEQRQHLLLMADRHAANVVRMGKMFFYVPVFRRIHFVRFSCRSGKRTKIQRDSAISCHKLKKNASLALFSQKMQPWHYKSGSRNESFYQTKGEIGITNSVEAPNPPFKANP